MLNSPKYVMIYTNELEESIQFYVKVLKLEVRWRFAEYCGLSNGIILHKNKDMILKFATYFHVSNTKEFVESVREHCQVVKEPTSIMHGDIAVVNDLDGNDIAVFDGELI